MIATDCKMVSKAEIAQLLRLKNADSVKHYHKKWINGIHYSKCPGGNRSSYDYNLELINTGFCAIETSKTLITK